MKVSEAKAGRVFVIRLEDGDILHEEIERFTAEQGVRAATLSAVGGVDAGSRLIVKPVDEMHLTSHLKLSTICAR